MEEMPMEIEFQTCELRCPRCSVNWVSNLLVEHCNCLRCGMELRPEKHLVIESEEQIQ